MRRSSRSREGHPAARPARARPASVPLRGPAARPRTPRFARQTARPLFPPACSRNRAGAPRVLGRSLAGRPSRPLTLRGEPPSKEHQPEAAAVWCRDETIFQPSASFCVQTRWRRRILPLQMSAKESGVVLGNLRLEVSEAGRPREGSGRLASRLEHGRGPARHREDRAGVKPARCLTSEARSSRGRPARPQRGRRRVGRAQLEAAGRPDPTKAPRGIDETHPQALRSRSLPGRLSFPRKPPSA